jgi:hypothetical protein
MTASDADRAKAAELSYTVRYAAQAERADATEAIAAVLAEARAYADRLRADVEKLVREAELRRDRTEGLVKPPAVVDAARLRAILDAR